MQGPSLTSPRGQRPDLREYIDRLEEVKDFIIGFFEGASRPDPATRAMWQDDANEAFLNAVAAYDLLTSGSEDKKEEDRSASALSFLEMARSRVKQVSSELRTYRTDVAENLVSRLEEAFLEASQAMSIRAGVAPSQASSSFQAAEMVEDDHYALHCSSCGNLAATFSVEVPRLSATGEEAILYEGVTKSTHFDMSNEKAIFERLGAGNIRALHEYIEHLVEGGVDAYCPLCDRVYCREHYDPEEVWDEGFYDCTYGTCPAGHRRLLDD